MMNTLEVAQQKIYQILTQILKNYTNDEKMNDGKCEEMINEHFAEQQGKHLKVETPNPAAKYNNAGNKSQARKKLNNNCLVADENFGKMLVSEKAQLCDQDFEDMWKMAIMDDGQDLEDDNDISDQMMCYTKSEAITPTIIHPVPAPRRNFHSTSKITAPIPAPRANKPHSKICPAKPAETEELELALTLQPTTSSEELQSDCEPTETKTKNQQQPETPDIELQHAASFDDLVELPNRLSITPSEIKSQYILCSHDLDESQCEIDDLHESQCETDDFNRTQLSEEIDNIYKMLENTELDTTLSEDEKYTTASTDQGFETESNELDELESPQLVKDFSTPIKEPFQHQFSRNYSAKQQLFCAQTESINKSSKSLYDSESRFSPDHPLEHHDVCTTEQRFFDNASTLSLCFDVLTPTCKRSSKFWIKSADFSITLDINFIESERLAMLYETFSQISCNTKNLNFGIDDQKFSANNTNVGENNKTHISTDKGLSHYWISTGDLVIPFKGKLLSTHKIQSLFQSIKLLVEESGVLQFGVDDVEFSNIPEFWIQPEQFSIGSSYSMLVGLQAGNSNGLEGRSKYAWPHSKPKKVNGLDECSYKTDEDDFEIIESDRLSYSSRTDEDDFEIREPGKLSNSQLINENVLEIIETAINHNDLSNLNRDNLSQNPSTSYSKPSHLPLNLLDDIKGTPEYLIQLAAIVSQIINVIRSERLKEFSPKQLESYMFFFDQYTDMCLNICQDYMDNISAVLYDLRR